MIEFKSKNKSIYVSDDDDLKKLGITDSVKLFEDGFRTNTGRGFFEWWYFDASLDDGTTIVIVYMTKSIMEYKGPLKPGVMITITRPNEDKIFKISNLSKNTFTSSKKSCDVKIGPNWVKGDLKTYTLHAKVEDIIADLTFNGIVPPFRPRDGKIFFGDINHYFGWVAPIPYGTVSGTLTYNGKTHKVTGSGYHDHNWGNLALPSVQDHWYWGRAQFDDYTIIFVEQITRKKFGSKKLPVLMLAKGDKILTGNGVPLKLKTTDFTKYSSGRKYPNKLVFSWELEGNTIDITLNNPKVIEAASLLSSFPKWKQKILRLFVNPYYFRFESKMDLKIDFGDIKAHKKGLVLYELMQLK
ncbi:MAG: hypothetical protein KAG94_02145 [Clostridiales bacterium]|nr:hypothetical protein [Clostridiales bacterium]